MDAIVATLQLAAASATAVAQAQALLAAGNLTLNGASVTSGVATFDAARRVGVASVGNDSGITFTIYGGDYSGNAISETITGANAGTASTLQDFLTVTRVSGSAATAANVTVGTTAKGSTPWFVPSWHMAPIEIAVGLEALTGSATATVEVTDDSPLAKMMIYTAGWSMTPPVPVPFDWPGLSAIVLTAGGTPSYGDINRNCAAIRLTITAGTGKIQLVLRQAGFLVG